MRYRNLVLAALAALLFSTATFADTSRKVEGWVEDTTRPGLKQPQTFDLDDRAGNPLTTTANVGVVGGTNVSAVENGTPFVHTTVFALTAESVAITDATTAGAHGGVQLYDFPAGLIAFVGASSDLSITAGEGGIADTAQVVCSLGSVVTATDNATLTSTEADYGASTAATLSGGVGACDIDGTTALIAIHNGSGTAKDAFLNFAIPDAGVTDGQDDTLAVTGTVTLSWIFLGDN